MRTKGRSKKNGNYSWSLFPNLHKSVMSILEQDGLSLDFNPIDDEITSIKDYDTHIMGRFKCHNQTCDSDGWSSKKIATTIRMYPGGRYNSRVYHQRCKRCHQLSRPTLDDSYAERVAYRIKKWLGVEVESPFYAKKQGPPHNHLLCEGCKHGHCRELGD